MEFFLSWEIRLILKMQEMDVCLTPIMNFFTSLGNPGVYLLIIAIVYWSVDRKLGLRLAIFLPFVISLNGILKQAFHAPRPYWVNPDIEAIQASNGFGLPSGHAQASTFYIYGAAWMKKGWVWLVAMAVTFMVGWSRVYLGVHFPNQVLLGWALGSVVLLLFYFSEERFLDWFLQKGRIVQLAWIFGITFLIMLAGILIVRHLKDWPIPPDWISNSSDDLACKGESICSSRGIARIAASAGGFLGMTLGALLSYGKNGFDTDGRTCRRICKSIAGILCTAILGVIIWSFKPNETSIRTEETLELLNAIWYFCGMCVISFFVIFLFPLLYRRFMPE